MIYIRLVVVILFILVSQRDSLAFIYQQESPYEFLIMRAQRESDFTLRSLEFSWSNYVDGRERPFYTYVSPSDTVITDFHILDEYMLYVLISTQEPAGARPLGDGRIERVDLLTGETVVLHERRNLIGFDPSPQGNYALLTFYPPDVSFVQLRDPISACILEFSTGECIGIDIPPNSDQFLWANNNIYLFWDNTIISNRERLALNMETNQRTIITMPTDFTGYIRQIFSTPVSYTLFIVEDREVAGERWCYLWRMSNPAQSAIYVGTTTCEEIQDITSDDLTGVTLNITQDVASIVLMSTGETQEMIHVPFNPQPISYNRPNWENVQLIQTGPQTNYLFLDLISGNNGTPLLRAIYQVLGSNTEEAFQAAFPLQSRINIVVPVD